MPRSLAIKSQTFDWNAEPAEAAKPIRVRKTAKAKAKAKATTKRTETVVVATE